MRRRQLIIIDNFLDNPDAVRNYALNQKFELYGGKNWPGRDSSECHGVKEMTQACSDVVGEKLIEKPDNKTWVAIIITFIACVYIFYDSLSLGNFYGDLFGLITSFGLACNANIARYAKSTDLVPAAVIGKSCVAIFAFFFVDSFTLAGNDIIFIPLLCVLCVAIPFVLVTIAPRFITGAEVNLFFLLETILGPVWVWMVIKEQPSLETI